MKSSRRNFKAILFSAIGISSVVVFIYSKSSPGNTSTPSASDIAQVSTSSSKDLVSVAASNDTFNMLVTALQAADLTANLSDKGPYTIFAPTDAAFAALPKKTWQNLLKPENKKQLVKILTYHVIPGDITSSKLKPGKVKTLEGSFVTVKVSITNNKITINNAQVVQTNIPASNGVIHVINKVLLPPKFKLSKF